MGVDSPILEEPSGLDVRAAAAIGVLTATVGGDRDEQGRRLRFLRGMLGALWSGRGYLILRHGDRVESEFVGLLPGTLGPGSAGEADELLAAVGEAAVWRCDRAGRSALLDTDFERAVLGVPPRSLLRISATEDGREMVVLALRRVGVADFSDALIRSVSLLTPMLARAVGSLLQLRPRPREPGRRAWERCNVPLIWVHRNGTAVASNPSAVRKLGLDAPAGPLPEWLALRVRERIDALSREGGLPTGVSGDYSWARVDPALPVYRIGLVPLESESVGGAPMWLLSVEEGGPGRAQRLLAAQTRYALSPRELDVLRGIADGQSNRQLGKGLQVSEATVKYHLTSLLQKSGCSSRTELLATLYSLEG